jgi:hypothetical protein
VSESALYLGPDEELAYGHGALEEALLHRAEVVLGVALELEHVDVFLDVGRQRGSTQVPEYARRQAH